MKKLIKKLFIIFLIIIVCAPVFQNNYVLAEGNERSDSGIGIGEIEDLQAHEINNINKEKSSQTAYQEAIHAIEVSDMTFSKSIIDVGDKVKTTMKIDHPYDLSFVIVNLKSNSGSNYSYHLEHNPENGRYEG